ncbi:MAG: AAA family ATPase [bacterium]|nr:AAA family ATPase [bacterium]
MRRFSSYGPIDTELHYFAPRQELIDKTYSQLIGGNATKGGHYITVWAPRQTGKTWVMGRVLMRLQEDERFDVLKINLEHLKTEKNVEEVIAAIAEEIGEGLGKDFSGVKSVGQFQKIFKKDILTKPLILILDEFDALVQESISALAGAFRNIYIKRMDEVNQPAEKRTYRLHGVALIGVRSVQGIENEKGSPFNIQRSLHVPNLTFDEVKSMFQWYEKESRHKVEPEAVQRLYYETNGQPGLTGWFGELLTEGFDGCVVDGNRPVDIEAFDAVYAAAVDILPNNTILNIISKSKNEPEKSMVQPLLSAFLQSICAEKAF